MLAYISLRLIFFFLSFFNIILKTFVDFKNQEFEFQQSSAYNFWMDSITWKKMGEFFGKKRLESKKKKF